MTTTPRSLGSSTGLSVFPIGYGAMWLSIREDRDEDADVKTLLAALEEGASLVDTADAYCWDDADVGHNERLIARALKEWRGHRVVVATKGGVVRPQGRWENNGRPAHLKAACERSLKALEVDAIELYQLHAPDSRVRFADSVGALAELRREGKIVHVGLSNVNVGHIEEARAIVEVASVQNRCNPFDRQSFDNGVVDYCTEHGIAFLPYAPVGGGRGKARTSEHKALAEVAGRHGTSPHAIALAWLLAKSPVMLPIPGTTRAERARANVRAADVELSAEDHALLDAAFPTTTAAR